jgi:hypothetical protein
MSHSKAAKELGLGRKGVARLGTYFHDSKDGKRTIPNAEFLYLACLKLGFEFAYNGCKLSAATLSRNGSAPTTPTDQLSLPFDRQFNLTDEAGMVSLSVRRRPPGKIEVSFSLKAIS